MKATSARRRASPSRCTSTSRWPTPAATPSPCCSTPPPTAPSPSASTPASCRASRSGRTAAPSRTVTSRAWSRRPAIRTSRRSSGARVACGRCRPADAGSAAGPSRSPRGRRPWPASWPRWRRSRPRPKRSSTAARSRNTLPSDPARSPTMRRLLTALLLLPLAAAFAPAADEDDPPPPPPDKIGQLTRQEIAAGWISLFDGESTFGWHAPDGSKWNVVSGMLAPEGTKPALLVCDTAFGDYDLHVEYRTRPEKEQPQVLVDGDRDGKHLHDLKESDKQGVPSSLRLRHFGNSWVNLDCQVLNGLPQNVQESTGNARFASKTAVAVEPLEQQPKRQPYHLALSGSGLVVRSIRIRPHLPEQLFNGKDL